MNYLMTKTRGRSSADFIIMTSEEAFYQLPNIVNSLAYNDEYKLQNEEWFALDDFSQKCYCWELLKSPFDATAYSNLPRDRYPNMNYLYAVQGEDLFCFQKMTKSKVLRKRLLSLSLNQEPQCLDMEYVVVINDVPDAIYGMDEDKLYFRKLSDITNIFPGIDELYREATDEETTDFLNLGILDVDADYTVDKVKTANRRRIKAAMDKYNGFTDEQKQKLPTYLQNYNANMPYDQNTGKFKIASEKELTDLLNGINQRYYTTEIDGEKRLANSVVTL